MIAIHIGPQFLDTRQVEKGKRCQAVLEGFDRLEPGQTLRVLTDHDPRPLLKHLGKDRPGIFEWTPVEGGPELWRTDLFRRAANRGELRRVGEALSWDHDRLDALAVRAFDERAQGRFDAAGETWAEFAHGLLRHIRFEEQIVFPAFEQKTGMPREAGPTAVMRAEHRDIEMILEGIGETIRAAGPAADTLHGELRRVLGGHNEKEEMVLYPGIDNLLTAEESDELVARVQAAD